MSSQKTDRRRLSSVLSSASSFLPAFSSTAQPAGKVSAVILISGALVASLALPASAATPTSTATSARSVTALAAVAIPSAAQAPLLPRTFGKIGFTGVVKRRPVVAPVHRQREVQVSRSHTRTAIRPTQNAPRAMAPRSGGVLGMAGSLAGISYIYGGTTPAGFDCSGFTQYVFGNLGISLPRTAEEQRQAASSVSDPQPGDLVFFGAPAYHVGIYAGNGMMWDSPHTGAVTGQHAVWSSTATYGRP